MLWKASTQPILITKVAYELIFTKQAVVLMKEAAHQLRFMEQDANEKMCLKRAVTLWKAATQLIPISQVPYKPILMTEDAYRMISRHWRLPCMERIFTMRNSYARMASSSDPMRRRNLAIVVER